MRPERLRQPSRSCVAGHRRGRPADARAQSTMPRRLLPADRDRPLPDQPGRVNGPQDAKISRFWKTASFENPILRRRAQLLQALFAARLGVDAHDRLSSRQPVADPGTVAEYQLQPVGANHAVNRVAAELPRIGLQLLSELGFDLGRQAEVLPFRIEGTNLVTH